ncbi:unnamed protein product [Caenorhabditis auriculariae]|uniref:Uncharacterized protein n=1 Tax=Caenorhabditis auriculariae TaxID=2777116 RepID=A0A8S1HUT4_9PELO|nr:unnamed protein product [Caenorhabditis auriculariae]
MEYDDLWLSNVDDDLGDVDSDEEQNFGEKSLALLKSLLSPSQSLTAFAEAQRQKFLSGNVGDDDIRQQKAASLSLLHSTNKPATSTSTLGYRGHNSGSHPDRQCIASVRMRSTVVSAATCSGKLPEAFRRPIADLPNF